MEHSSPETSLVERLARSEARAEALQLQADTALKYAEQIWWSWNLPRKRIKIRSIGQCILGYGDDDLRREDSFWWNRIHPKDLRAVQTSLRSCLEGRTSVWRCEHRLLDVEDKWAWVEESGIVHKRDAAGQALEMVGTTRKREEVYQLLDLVEGADAVIGAFSASSPIRFCLRDPEGVILLRSRALEEEFSQTLGDPLEQALSHSEADLETWQSAFHSTLRGSENELDLTLRIASGITRRFALHLIPVSQHGHPFCILELFVPRGD